MNIKQIFNKIKIWITSLFKSKKVEPIQFESRIPCVPVKIINKEQQELLDKNLTLKDLIMSQGVFSKDLKQKIKQGQIKLNDFVVKEEDLNEKVVFFQEIGDFIYYNSVKLRNTIIIAGTDSLFDTNLKASEDYKQFSMLRLSKKQLFVIEFDNVETTNKYKELQKI